MGRGEIVTLQLGHTASFVGSHFWNAQDAMSDQVDSSILFREGISKGVSTYAPRLVLLDLRGSLGALKKTSPLYEGEVADPAWNSGIQIVEQDPPPKNKFLDSLDEDHGANVDDKISSEKQDHAGYLDSAVKVWSDFNTMYFHPRTIVELRAFNHDDSCAPFEQFQQGWDAWVSDPALRDDFIDEKLRYFLEECDSPQAVQVFADCFDGFSGLSAAVLEEVREAVGKLSIITFGLENTDIPTQRSTINASLASAHITESANLYIPLNRPTAMDSSRIRIGNISKKYQYTSLMAAAIDTLTIPSRMTKGSIPLSHLVYPVTQGGPICSLASSIPVFDTDFASPEKWIQGSKVEWMYDWTFSLPYDLIETNGGQTSILRGIQEPRIWSQFEAFTGASSTPPHSNLSFTSKEPFPISASFPNVLNQTNRPVSIPCLARLRASSRIADYCKKGAKTLQALEQSLAMGRTNSEIRGLSADDIAYGIERMYELKEEFEESSNAN